ncbi:MAG: hypothetical protein LBE89_06765 [Helicobacteraceae bacterium]|nr:hypothetical protein [Helicobacteraceae bacterium]
MYKFFLTIAKDEQSAECAAHGSDRAAKVRLEVSDRKADGLYGEWTKADLAMPSYTPHSPGHAPEANDKGDRNAKLLYDLRIVTIFTQMVKF